MTKSLPCILVASLALVAVSRGAPTTGTTSRPTSGPSTRPIIPKPDAADAFFNSALPPRLRIEINAAGMKALDRDPRTPVPAQVYEIVPNGEAIVYNQVGVHLKGGPGSFRKMEEKPALTLNFDKFVPGQNFHGLEKIHLNNSVQDGSFMCERLGSFLFRESGCPATRVLAARVWVNGRDLGPFVLKEGYDGVFFKKFFKDKSGNMYEGSFTDIDREMPIHPGVNPPPVAPSDKAAVRKQNAEIEANRKAANAKLKQLADACREPDAVKRHAQLDAVLDVDRFITFMACETLVAHWDGYCANRNNYRIYHDPRSDRLVFLPQGMDQLFQRPDYPMFGAGAMVAAALTQTAEDKLRLADRIAQIRLATFNPETMLAELDRAAANLRPLMTELGPDYLNQHMGETAGLKQRVTDRIARLDYQIAHPPRPVAFDAKGFAKLAAWEPKQQEGNAEADKVEEDGKSRLRITCTKPGGAASWRQTILLPQGHYLFEGRMKTTGVVAQAIDGENTGAGLRVSMAKRVDRLVGDTPWQKCKYEFDVAETLGEVILVCDLAATKGTALVDVESLTLRRK